MSKGFNNGAYEHRIWYNAGRVRVKSRKKIEKAYDFAIDTLKKQEKFGITDKFGMSKWVYKTKMHAFGRLKKFGINMDMLNAALESKGLKELARHI
jgi:hypothetical protein